MPIPCAVLMCHAPIVIPEVAGPRAEQCARTTAAMAETAAALLRHAPDAIVIISPHTPRDRVRFGVVNDAILAGDFGRFGVPEVGLQLPGAPHAAAALQEAAREAKLSTWSPSGRALDHGALVPLHFVVSAGWNGPTLLLALPYPGTGTEARMGRAIAAAAAKLGERWCVLASGDMSHRLSPDAPAGYHPSAREFDERFRGLIERGELQHACALSTHLREIAAEDAVDSCTVAAAAVGFDAAGHHAFSYEAPFGVGYLEAVLYDQPNGAPTQLGSNGKGSRARSHPLLPIARSAIRARLEGETFQVPILAPPWDRPRGVFVTLRCRGELRGCVGHVEPLHESLAGEVASCAVSAAFQDPRFAPLLAEELDGIDIELSLLSPCEPVDHIDALDPHRFGVVVSAGQRRGVLLPGIDGIHSAHDQLQIALRKAGLTSHSEVCIERFEVVKLEEASVHTSARLRPRSHELH